MDAAPWGTDPRRARFVEAQADRQVVKRLYDAIARRLDVPRDLIDELNTELDRMPDAAWIVPSRSSTTA